jgi:hypothetical protein
MKWHLFMKPIAGGGDESLTRPPPREVRRMPASGPAFCLKKRIASGSRRVEVAPEGVFRFRKRTAQLVRRPRGLGQNAVAVPLDHIAPCPLAALGPPSDTAK